jgi:hypothetical protein
MMLVSKAVVERAHQAAFRPRRVPPSFVAAVAADFES